MGFIAEVKRARELGRQFRRVQREMKWVKMRDIEERKISQKSSSLKSNARKVTALIAKLRNIQSEMGEWELGRLAVEADKEGKKLDKLIALAEARERVTQAKIQVHTAKTRLRTKGRAIVTAPKKKTVKPKKLTPKRPKPKITKPKRMMPKRPKLAR